MKKTILDVCHRLLQLEIIRDYLGPKCDSVIDHVNPWRVLVFDRTLQSIAYKLVPNLYKGLSDENDPTSIEFFFLSRGN